MKSIGRAYGTIYFKGELLQIVNTLENCQRLVCLRNLKALD